MESTIKNSRSTEALQTMLSVKVPEQTRTYKPVSHEELMNLTMESIHQSGYKLASQEYSIAEDGEIANGRYTISNVADNEMQLQVAWQNSYNRKVSLKFALGTKIMICSNGMVSGNYGSFKSKHVGNVQTVAPSNIVEYIKKGSSAFSSLQRDRDLFKQYEATDQVKAELLGRMFIQDEIITSTQLNIIKRELVNPTHNYGAEGSLWDLYNHATFALKGSHPSKWMSAHSELHTFFSNVITPSPAIINIDSFSTADNQVKMF
tara:strand:- start:1202 stop:1987 length:786 start_codon:yes stop_codon:yes gene_type:complete